jgi:cysteine desulfurase
VAKALSAAPAEIVFTSGATEAAALAIRGVMGAAGLAGGARRELVLTEVEHPCVRSLGQVLEAGGHPVRWVPVDRDGVPGLEALREAVSARTALVCGIAANNETGVVLPVRELAAEARNAGALFFCDAVQVAGKQELDVSTLGADLVAFTGRKLGGPPGAGGLWVRSGIPLQPLFGGHQERGRRAGTENLPGIVGLGAALAAALEQRAEEQSRIAKLREALERGVLERIPGARVNGVGARRLAGTSSITLPGCDGEALLIALDLEGICASAGSACTSGSTAPSHVLTAMGLTPTEARATLRFSLGWSSTAGDVEGLLGALPRLVERVRAAIPTDG